MKPLALRLAACALLSACSFFGQVNPGVTRDYPGAFDIREVPGAGAPDQQALAQRLAEAEEFLAAPAPPIPAGLRVVWSQFGLPKSLFHERAALTAPSRDNPERIAKDFLWTYRRVFRFSRAEIENLRLLVNKNDDGAVYLGFNQTVGGLPVFRGQVKVALNAAGEVVHAGVGDVAPSVSVPSSPRLSAQEAVRAAMELVGLDPAAPRDESLSPITSELYIFPMTASSARLAWRIFLEVDSARWYEMLIDAEDGRLLFRHNLWVNARGRVWRESPLKGPRELVTFPDGWLPAGGAVTTGNNVDAYVDVDANNAPDSEAGPNTLNGRGTSATQDFDFPAPDGPNPQDPLGYKAASTTNLFYFVNTAHDYFYGLGFDEASGNFQNDNFGRGGAGNDAIIGQALFGATAGFTNNASFAPTPDGTRPRLRMFLWTVGSTGTQTHRDSDYDGGVVLHEYAHGVSTRLVGNRTDVSCLFGTQGGALGEGWSDYFAASFFNNPVLAAYLVREEVNGIRRRAFDTYRFTFEDIGNDGFEIHSDGEIWAATLWDLRQTLGQALADRLVVSGLRMTPCRPSMIDARDGILAADRAASGGANRRRTWEVFARHGLGSSAAGFDGSFTNGTVYTAAFDLPPDLQAGNRFPSITSQPPAAPGASERYTYRIIAADPDGGALTYELTQRPAGMEIDANGVITWTATFVSQRVKVTITDAQGGRVVHGFRLIVNTPLQAGTPVSVSGPAGSVALANLIVPEGIRALQVSLREGAGDANLILLDPNGNIAAESYRGSFFPTGGVPSPNTETLSIDAPRAGRWTAVVLSNCDRPPGPPCRIFSDVVLTAALLTPTPLTGNSTVTGLNGGVSSETFFRITVPAGATSLRVSSTGGVGDVSLMLRRNGIPTCAFWIWTLGLNCRFDSASLNRGNNETVAVAGPQAGEWFVNLTGFTGSFNGVTLTTELMASPTLALSSNSLTFNSSEGAAPPAQTLSISDPTGTVFNWTAVATTQAGGPWLQLSLPSGSGNASIAVSANPAGLTPGTYRGTITVTGTGLSRSPQTVEVTLNVTTASTLTVGASNVSFTPPRGQNPASRAVPLSFSGGGPSWTAAATTRNGGNWLTVNPPSGAGNATLTIGARVEALADGAYEGTITITAAGARNSPVSISVTLTVGGLAVVLSSEGVVNAGSFANRPITVNEILTLFGQNFTDPCSLEAFAQNPCPRATGFPLPTQLGQTQVTMNGVLAPLLVVTPTQINLLAPFGLTGGTVTIVVTRGSVSSSGVSLARADQSIGIFTALANGAGAGIILHADNRLVTRDSAIAPDEVLIIYLTGLGDVTPPIQTGQPAPFSPLSTARISVRVFFDGGEGRVLFAGPTPGFAGLYQINVSAPSSLARRYPLVRVQSSVSVSNEVSAGGPSVLDITPNTARANADVTVQVRGVNFGPGSVLLIGGEQIPALRADGAIQTLTAVIPARLLRGAGPVNVAVADSSAPAEAPSNPVTLTVQ